MKRILSIAIPTVFLAACAAHVGEWVPLPSCHDAAPAADDAADAAPTPDDAAADDAAGDAQDLSRCWNPPGDPAGCSVDGCERTRPPGTSGQAYCLNPELCCAR